MYIDPKKWLLREEIMLLGIPQQGALMRLVCHALSGDMTVPSSSYSLSVLCRVPYSEWQEDYEADLMDFMCPDTEKADRSFISFADELLGYCDHGVAGKF